jgi:ribose transport system ATP-binding protein
MLLQMNGIRKQFPGVVALNGVDFSMDRGEVHCLVGANGAGKSTLVRILSGAYPDYEGVVLLDGERVHLGSPRDARRHGVAAIHQGRDLVPTLSGIENVYLGSEVRTGARLLDKRTMTRRAAEHVERMGVKIDLRKPVEQLSIPDQEIIAIAKALSTDCRLLMVDEATAPLDSAERQKLFEVIRKLKESGTGVLYISHNLEEILQIGDRVTVLRDGRVIGTRPVKDTSLNEIIHLMVGDIQEFHKAEASRGEAVLSVRDLKVPGAVDGVSFDLHKGEILGITGLAGCGKDQVLEGLFGLLPRISGRAHFGKRQMKFHRPLGTIRDGIGLLPDNRREKGLIPCRAVSENIGLTVINSDKSFRTSPNALSRLARQFVKELSIVLYSPNQRVEYLSGGNQQKVVFGKWLAARSEVLMLNEPTEGIDIRVRRELYDTLGRLAREGKSILIATGDVDEILTVSDRILVMVRGRMAGEFVASKTNKREILECMLQSAGAEVRP